MTIAYTVHSNGILIPDAVSGDGSCSCVVAELAQDAPVMLPSFNADGRTDRIRLSIPEIRLESLYHPAIARSAL